MTIGCSCMCKVSSGLSRVAKDRLADPARIDVVEIEVQLPDHPDIGAALAVDGYQCLEPNLKGSAYPDDTGIDGACSHGSRTERIRHRRLQICLHQRDQVIDEIGQAEVDDGRLQVRHAVLDRSTPV